MVTKKKNARKVTLNSFFFTYLLQFRFQFKFLKARHLIHLYILEVQHNSWHGEDTQKIINNDGSTSPTKITKMKNC